MKLGWVSGHISENGGCLLPMGEKKSKAPTIFRSFIFLEILCFCIYYTLLCFRLLKFVGLAKEDQNVLHEDQMQTLLFLFFPGTQERQILCLAEGLR